MERDLTSESLDAILLPRRSPRIIWTAAAIAERIGTSANFVRDKLAKEPGSPVRQVGGRYCAIETDLLNFFKGR